MISHQHNRFICSVDPISLTGLAALSGAGAGDAAAGGGLFGSLGSLLGLGGAAAAGAGAAELASSAAKSSTATPPPPAAPAPTMVQPVNQPLGQKPTARSTTPTFLGAAATPPTQSGQKSLLGQ